MVFNNGRIGILALAMLSVLALAVLPGVAAAQKSANPVVVIETSLGDITVELFAAKAPKSVENFLIYANAGFYRGTIFHRVIKGFMIQGGGLTESMQRKSTNSPIVNEATNGLSNSRGTIAMARTGVVNSATSQFFINTADNTALDHRSNDPDGFGYAVFGKVIEGMDVVKKIENSKTGNKSPYQNVPTTPIVIKDVKVQS